ncbi:queuine tRNA-ribosyltransferase [Trypanosoma brucei equiperdum]|uniref:Queuine tRNA-ribosyltransferase accessory subunit 2 n=1 Tax=Trypanosoma brucei equiperdum TaxID=630700 RepID=A0A3L6LB15_9TRYP|nr:queuine tRNA-ribosyltransferase [Trypanosoma brucei equiperdum]
MHGVYPILVVPCRRGGIPYLTPEQARDILGEEERILSLSIFDAYEYKDACKKAGKSFAEFCGLGEFRVILTVRSPYVGAHASVSASETAVFGVHEKGRISFSNESWAEIVKSVMPNMAITLYDSVPLHEQHSKRRKTASTRSLKWAKSAECAPDTGCELIKASSVADRENVFVCADELGQNETIVQYASRLCEITKNHYVMSPTPSLGAVLMALKVGASFIECALPWTLAERGIALVFDMNPVHGCSPQRYESQIDLNDHCFAVDINPLSQACVCSTCRRHTRAYVHHLLTVQEMNSCILLVVHNLAFLVQLIGLYRRSTAEARESLLTWVLAQL